MSSAPSNEKFKISETKLKPKNNNYIPKINNTEKINNKTLIERLTPITIKEREEIVLKTVTNEEEEKKGNNTKLKLLAALNNINDEINVIIDSKDRYKNPNLNLDCFINRPSKKNKTVVNKNINNDNDLQKFIVNNNNLNNNTYKNDLDDIINSYKEGKDSINNENVYDINNINDNNNLVFNFKSTENKDDTEPNNDEKYNKTLNDLISLSVKKEDINDQTKKNGDNNENEMNNKDKIEELNININNINNNNNIKSNYIKPLDRYENNNNNDFSENYSKPQDSKNYEKLEKIQEKIPEKILKNNLNEKITLYNLDNDDKTLLKNMERNSSFIITDISSLNKKDITNYNISLSRFDIKKILNYYFFLVKENKKEQISLMNFKNNLSDLKNNLSASKKDEFNNKYENIKEKENKTKNYIKNNNLNNIKNMKNNIGIDVLSRYQKDLNFFEEQINNLDKELKNI